MTTLAYHNIPFTPPTYSGQITALADYNIPREGVRIAVSTYLDAANARNLVVLSSPFGNQSTLCRNATEFIFWTHNASVACIAQPIGEPCPAAFALPTHHFAPPALISTNYRGKPAITVRAVVDTTELPFADSTLMQYTLDAQTQALLSFTNPGQDGIYSQESLDYWQFDDGLTPPEPVFDVPLACQHVDPRTTRSASSAPRRSPLPAHKWPTLAARTTRLTSYVPPGRDCPKSVDNSALAPAARDQGICGGCWAFSAAAVAQVVWAKAQGRTAAGYGDWLSPQVSSCPTLLAFSGGRACPPHS